MTATQYVLLILTVGPILAGGPPLLAVWLCERHADNTAAAIRRQHARQLADRPKELTR